MSELLKTLKKSSTSGYAHILSESEFMYDKAHTRTYVPAINIAFSGEVDGGMTSGLTVLAGPSKHFKSNLGLVGVAAYLKKYENAVCVFIDTEFGITPAYLKACGVDPARVLHIQCETVERMKFEMANQLKDLTARKAAKKKGDEPDRVVFFIDSVGNVASAKEVEDAQNESSKADMTRAKQLKSLFRIVTPYFTMLDIPCIAINHTYQTQEMYSKTVMSGGTGIMYSADTVIILGKQQEKDGKEIVGYHFIMNIEKSRFVKEKMKIPLTVTYKKGIDPFSGLLDIALETGYVVKPSNGWYQRASVDAETGEMIIEEQKYRAKDTQCNDFWKPIINNPQFKAAVKHQFCLGQINEDDMAKEIDDLFD
ncbi:recA bacterial DNA recombination protein [Vibrio phage 1.081.O._10N.286.52.C2]|nr:recA bacterial DNA recombination protein [Vibrio phage 1.081.O._10N.286.52.C2]